MTSYIALLRGVNVGGKQKVPMADLRAAVESLGFADVRTLLNSGNVVFRTDRPLTPGALETQLEVETAKRLGLRTDFHVRTAAEWRGVITANPFPEVAANSPNRYIAWCLKGVPAPGAVEALRASYQGPEIFQADGRQLYIVYDEGMASSRLSPALLDSKLRQRGTGRNWNTVLKLAALAGA